MLTVAAIVLFLMIIIAVVWMLIKLLIYLIPMILILSALGGCFWIISEFGFKNFFYVLIPLLVIFFIAQYFKSRKFKRASNKIEKYFLEYEMADYDDLYNVLNLSESNNLDEILSDFIQDGMVERIYLNQGRLYKWIGKGSFSKGIVRKEITLD